jgi:hypothetical protein
MDTKPKRQPSAYNLFMKDFMKTRPANKSAKEWMTEISKKWQAKKASTDTHTHADGTVMTGKKMSKTSKIITQPNKLLKITPMSGTVEKVDEINMMHGMQSLTKKK